MKELCFSVGPINVYFGGLDRWAVTLMHYCTRARWEAGCRDDGPSSKRPPPARGNVVVVRRPRLRNTRLCRSATSRDIPCHACLVTLMCRPVLHTTYGEEGATYTSRVTCTFTFRIIRPRMPITTFLSIA